MHGLCGNPQKEFVIHYQPGGGSLVSPEAQPTARRRALAVRGMRYTGFKLESSEWVRFDA